MALPSWANVEKHNLIQAAVKLEYRLDQLTRDYWHATDELNRVRIINKTVRLGAKWNQIQDKIDAIELDEIRNLRNGLRN